MTTIDGGAGDEPVPPAAMDPDAGNTSDADWQPPAALHGGAGEDWARPGAPDDGPADEWAPPAPAAADERSGEERLQQALELGYAYLSRRDRTVSEVRAQLKRKGISGDVADTAVATIAEQGMLDDARFARLFVADKRALEEWGSERILRGLLSRGIDRDEAEAALAEHAADAGEPDEPETELDRALGLLRRRFPAPPEDRRERERALGVLLRKGYESETALDALAAHARGD